MEEIWKDVAGYEGYYKVSNMGNVFGVKRNHVLVPGTTGRYLFVILSKDGKRKDALVHRLVADAFCEKPENKNVVNHINEIKTDNRASNLEWYTTRENVVYNGAARKRGEKERNNKRSKPVIKMSLCGEEVERFASIREMVRQTGFDRSFVVKCINGQRPTAYGFTWRFA